MFSLAVSGVTAPQAFSILASGGKTHIEASESVKVFLEVGSSARNRYRADMHGQGHFQSPHLKTDSRAPNGCHCRCRCCWCGSTSCCRKIEETTTLIHMATAEKLCTRITKP